MVRSLSQSELGCTNAYGVLHSHRGMCWQTWLKGYTGAYMATKVYRSTDDHRGTKGTHRHVHDYRSIIATGTYGNTYSCRVVWGHTML